MPTASAGFLLFSAAVAIACNLSRHPLWRGWVLLAANLAYLATVSTDPSAFLPFAAFLAIGYAAILASGRRRSGKVLGTLVMALTLGFCWLKKYWFLSGLGFISSPYVTIGLSYIFFRVMHLVIDAQSHREAGRLSFLSYLNYTLNFTALVAGPIQRYEDFLKTPPPIDLCIAGRAAERIVIGLFKVLVVAALLSTVQTQATADLLAHHDGPDRLKSGLVAIAGYPIYLYFNFSGYMDIVIGVARFIGMELPENFNRPFSSVNFIEFWGRYHMTLSNWLRDYVYTPLLRVLMTRFPKPGRDPFLATLAFFVTFFLIGIWHGPTAIFATYGVLLAVGISGDKLYQTALLKLWGRRKYRALAEDPVYRAVCRGLTFTWYAVSMLCFWADSDEASRILGALGPGGIAAVFLLLLVAATAALTVTETLRAAALDAGWKGRPIMLSRYTRTVWSVVLAFLCVSVAMLMHSPAPDIVYKTF